MTEFINQINEDIKEYQERYPHMANMNKNEWAFNFWVLDKLYKEDEQLIEDLGATGAINKKIMETLKNPDERVNFSIIIMELQLLQKIYLMRIQVVVLRN